MACESLLSFSLLLAHTNDISLALTSFLAGNVAVPY